VPGSFLRHPKRLGHQKYYSISFTFAVLHDYRKKLDEQKRRFNQEDVPGNVKDLFQLSPFISFVIKS
jgi:hypothetical protein